MNLHTLPPVTKPAKRVGRGPASGSGKTAGRGTKGQKSRAGHHMMSAAFEGGQMPFHMRLPKLRGFRNPAAFKRATVTLSQLAGFKGKKLNLETARDAGLVGRHARYLKIIGSGESALKLTIEADRISAGAKKALEKAGSTVVIKTPASPPAKKDAPDA